MSDDFGQQLLKLMMVRTLEGESQIDEHIQWNKETKAWTPLAQAATIFVGLLALCLGIGLVGWGTYTWDHTHSLWTIAPIVTGTCLIMAGALLSYRQARELLDPFGKTSPMERMIKPYLSAVFETEEPAPARERVILLRSRASESQAEADYDEGEDDGSDVSPNDDMGDFAAFVARLPHKGTSLRAWESELGRTTYQDYRDTLIGGGYARWNHTNEDDEPLVTQGWTLDAPTRAILQALSN